jgi:hypothetical protein
MQQGIPRVVVPTLYALIEEAKDFHKDTLTSLLFSGPKRLPDIGHKGSLNKPFVRIRSLIQTHNTSISKFKDDFFRCPCNQVGDQPLQKIYQ